MAYAVIVGSGYTKTTVRFPTADEALAKARDDVEHGVQNVIVRVSETGEEFTPEEFASKLATRPG